MVLSGGSQALVLDGLLSCSADVRALWSFAGFDKSQKHNPDSLENVSPAFKKIAKHFEIGFHNNNNHRRHQSSSSSSSCVSADVEHTMTVISNIRQETSGCVVITNGAPATPSTSPTSDNRHRRNRTVAAKPSCEQRADDSQSVLAVCLSTCLLA